MSESTHPSPIFHIGIVVADLEQAKQQLGTVLGLTWGRHRHVHYGDWELHGVTSIEGPPYIELQQGSPGSPWDANGHARFDHIQRWSPDLAADMTQLTANGATIDIDGADLGLPFCYMRTNIGLRIELIDETMRPQFRSLQQIDGDDDA